jgi:hypothetical protein
MLFEGAFNLNSKFKIEIQRRKIGIEEKMYSKSLVAIKKLEVGEIIVI